MATVFRADIGSALRPLLRLPDGGIRVDATLARTGVQIYRDGKGGVRREWRPPSEVSHPDSIASFANLPITDDHPPEMITATNRDQYKRGRVADEVAMHGKHMAGALLIDDAKLISKMEKGKRQVSNGYTADLIELKGTTPDGEEYDAIQTNIRGNHVAIVDAGRAGSAVVRWDAAAWTEESTDASAMGGARDGSNNSARTDKEISTMEELQKKLGEALAKVAEETARANAANKRADEADTKAKELEGKVAAAETAAKTEKARADKGEQDLAAEKTRKDAADEAATSARVDAIVKGARVLGDKHGEKGKERDVASMSTREIQLAVVQKIKKLDLSDEKRFDPQYLAGRFDDACETHAAGRGSAGNARRAVNDARREQARVDEDGEDSGMAKVEAAKNKARKDGANAWQSKPGDSETDDLRTRDDKRIDGEKE